MLRRLQLALVMRQTCSMESASVSDWLKYMQASQSSAQATALLAPAKLHGMFPLRL